MVVQPSPGASAIPLSIEPVIGWRLWSVRWSRRGNAALVSPMRPYLWRPKMVNHAGCSRHVGKQVPSMGCMCGMYAVDRLDRLPMSFGAGAMSSVGVVGSVAMWGRVVEHTHGFRSQLAYPDRIRLICRQCFFAGREGVPTRVELGAAGAAMPVCDRHAGGGKDRIGASPDELEQALRSTYAIDLLPVRTLHEAGFEPGHPSPATFVAAAKAEARELSKPRFGWLAIALIFVVGMAMNVVGPFPATGPHEVPPEAPSGEAGEIVDVGPFADDVVNRPPRPPLVDPRPEPRSPLLGFGMVCGHRIGDAVQLMACGRDRAELIGVYATPPDRRSECVLSTGYTRKPNVSVCWMDPVAEIGPPFDVLRLPGVHLLDLEARWRTG